MSLRQATGAGLTRHAVAHLVSSGRWVRVYPRIYVTHTGPITVEARHWAAALYAGRGVVLSHSTANAIHGWGRHTDEIHVTVPPRRSPRPQRGIVIHRCELHPGDVLRRDGLPVTSPLRTVLDAVSSAPNRTGALAAVARGLQRNQVNSRHLRERVQAERRRWRAPVLKALDDIVAGSHSVLELEFAQLLRRHRLP
ncbi:MAG: hypothetical protein QOG52_1317, partial [Frankiaceae bacterium]|nr:hypothetical protein [Frankiaceae bacterium]